MTRCDSEHELVRDEGEMMVGKSAAAQGSPGGVDMDRRVFRSVGDHEGDVGAETEFRYRQAGDLVWARYSGGAVRLGFLVGTSDGAELHLRCTHVDTSGATATGASTDRIERLDDGRVRLHETWAWDSRDGSGTATLEEVRS